MYKKVDSSLDFVAREKEIIEFWQEQNIFDKQTKLRQDGEKFVFYDGPPTANGKPHIGHVLTRAIKDIIPRYHSMKGENVYRKAGWDTHGLPVELEVEKMLGIDGKDQIEAYGVEPFIKKCKESVWKYKTEWEEMSNRIGFWADMEHPYITYENNYIESVWWALRQIWDKNLIYEGHKVVPYCPRCGTALSSHEVAQGYKDIEEATVYLRFHVMDQPHTYLTAWTTTPWTLPSNLALCVHPNETYVLAEKTEEINGEKQVNRYYVAEALIESVLGKDVKIIEKMQGKELEGMRYEPLFPYAKYIIAQSHKDAYFVTVDTYVTMDEGTGIVHIAPAFGDDDARVGKEYKLPFVQFIKEDGTMPEEVTDFAGLSFKEADPKIIVALNEKGLLIREEEHTHNYPFCWRCDTPLIYYARQSWFIKMTELRDNLVDNNNTVNWIPKTIGTGRFGNFLENVVDWAVSRERYWGTPLPVWRCEDCGHDHLIGSLEELKSMSDDCPENLELHRPYIDQVHLKCPECGGKMTRRPEVIDTWFDSGSMPFAQYHYPFDNKDLFEKTFPANFISEAVDQTRGWFYTLMAIGTAIFDSSPFENCIVMGHVQDEQGRKMSKHIGNVVDPMEVLDKEGADAVRWYFFNNSQPWLPSRFSESMVNEEKRKFISGLWNTYAFYVLYADIDEFD
ncbi:MAG: isoleucine--tRNA ligase, partial [Clostridiaceae bacterium]|nr:isoleucine--tRNA ligase [Clostridiaceae bacterium]